MTWKVIVTVRCKTLKVIVTVRCKKQATTTIEK